MCVVQGGCQDPVFNTWQVLTMRNLFLQLSLVKNNSSTSKTETSFGEEKIEKEKPKPERKPRMVLMKRSSNARHTRNGHDSVRQWSDEFSLVILAALSVAFPGYEVQLFSDRDVAMMTCHACQVRVFAETDVLIGVHGAGLANMLYMKPNSAVVELGPYGNDGRCLLGGGPFSRLAAVLAHNYLVHHPPYEEYLWISTDHTSQFNVTRFVRHIYSFLTSIGQLYG